jgi:hypothetical protein
METLIKAIQSTPIPTILIVAGLFIIVLAFVTKIGGIIEVSPEQKRWAIPTGLFLLTIGLVLNFTTVSPPATSTTATPTTPASTSTQINISGTWHDSVAGSSFRVSQDGNKFQYTSSGATQGDPFQSSGNGVLNGQNFESSYTTQYQSGRWSEGKCYGTVSAVARQITSTCTDSVYGQFQSNIIRDR